MHSTPSSVGRLLLTGVPGTKLDLPTARLFRSLQPGGFILFGRNIESPQQLRKLIDDLRDLSRHEPIITIDQEGGRVSRLRLIGNEPPNARQLAQSGRSDLVQKHGELTATLLRLFGFNLNLCPVLDIAFDDDADNSLRGRCWGHSAEEVIHYASLFNNAMRLGGILSCGKHFPGYSRASVDPHHSLPIIDLTLDELERDELAVFKAFCGSQATVDSMMIGHAFYPALDSTRTPSSLSRAVVTDLLRGKLGYHGLIMTDDLDMGAILEESGFDATIHKALAAGNDLLMICHRMEMVEQAAKLLDHAPRRDLDRALEHLATFTTTLSPPLPFSDAAFMQTDAAVWDLRVEVLGEEAARERSPEDGKRSPVEIY